MGIVFIIIMFVLYALQSFTCKLYSDSYPGKESLSSPVFTIVSGLIVSAVSFLFTYTMSDGFSAQPMTVLLALFNALALVLYNASLIKASTTGPYSVLMVFLIAGGIILPTVSSIFFDENENLTWIKLICIAVIIVSVYLISNKGKETYENKKVFFLACFCLALGNGAYGSLINVQQKLTTVAEKEEMIALSYLFAVLISAVMLAVKEKKQFLAGFKQSKRSCVFLLVCSVITAMAIQVMAYLFSLSEEGFLDIGILATLDNAGTFILSTALSCIFFKEKLTVKNVIGIIFMCAAAICISAYGKELVIHLGF